MMIMKKITFFFFLLYITLSQAQQSVIFCPPGAKWHYNFDIYGFQFSTISATAEYIGDTLIDNQSVKKIRHPQFYKGSCHNSCFASTSYIKQHGDTVFMKNSCTSDWQILYNFDTPVGGQWTVSVNQPVSPVYTVMVTGVQTVSVKGMNLKQLYVSVSRMGGMLPNPHLITEHDTLTERLGGEYLFYFNTANCDGSNFKRFLCYEDNSFGLYQKDNSVPCDYTFTGLTEHSKSGDILIFPNPATHGISIRSHLPGPSYQLVLTDVAGRAVFHDPHFQIQGEAGVDLHHLPAGLYFLQLSRDDKFIIYQKIIKH
jgi:hypothetical protein